MVEAIVQISGLVLGVGFRQFVKSVAWEHAVTGWVQNTPDGTVEALCQGEKEAVEKVIAACWDGPMLAKVKDVKVTWKEVTGKKTTKQYRSFEILHTL